MRYNAGIMSDTLQITIRGLDPLTKRALVKKAAQRGLSLNRYALQSLKQAAGVEDSQVRYQRMKAAIAHYRIPPEEARRIDEAIAWGKQASLQKQKQDEARDFGV